MLQEEIVIVTEDTLEGEEGEKGTWGEEIRRRVTTIKEVRLSADELEQKMSAFLQMISRLFQQAEQQTRSQPGLELTEVELSVEISAKGELKLIAGGEAAGKGAIKLKFTRVETT